MDKGELRRRTEAVLQNSTWQRELWTATANRRQEILNERARTLAARFRIGFEQWEALFQTVKSSDPHHADGDRTSRPINLFTYNNPVWGLGIVQATITAAGAQRALPSFRTEFSFQNALVNYATGYEAFQVPDKENHPGLAQNFEELQCPEAEQFMSEGFTWMSQDFRDVGTAWSSLATFGHVAEDVLTTSGQTLGFLAAALADPRFNQQPTA